MKSHGATGGWSWNQIRDELTVALNAAQADLTILQSGRDVPESELRHAVRWIHNCLLHIVKPDIAQRRLKAADMNFSTASVHWRTMDIARGWDVGFRPTLLSLYGHIALRSANSDENIRIAMGYLVRGVALILGLRRQQPEGIRDLLFGIADGLHLLRQSVHERRIRAVAEQAVEYSSWFNPPLPRRR